MFAARSPEASLSALRKQAVVGAFRGASNFRNTLIADEDVVGDHTSPLAEAVAPAGAFAIWPTRQEAAFAPPTLLAEQRLVAAEVWGSRLDQLWDADQTQAVTKTRWRESYSGGRSIAQPAATNSQTQQLRRTVVKTRSSGPNAEQEGLRALAHATSER